MPITAPDRGEVEAKLDRYYKLVNLSVEGVLIHENGICIDVNVALERLFGYEREELIGKEVLFLVAPEHKEIVIKNIAKSGSQPYEVLGLRKDGKRIPILVEAYETEWEGKPIRVATMRDISSRKQEENAVLEFLLNEQYQTRGKPTGKRGDHMRLLAMRYMKEMRNAHALISQQRVMNVRILDSFPGIFYMYRMDGIPKLVKWNQNTELVLGYSPVELFEMNVLDFFEKEDHTKVLSAIKQLSKNGDTMLEANLVSKTGERRPFLFTTKKYMEAGSNYFFGFGTDISKRIKAEQELELYSEKLEFLVHERTQALIETNEVLASKNDELTRQQNQLESTLLELRSTQRELVQADKMASVGQLTAGVAHEINNPLNFIQAGIYSLRNILGETPLWQEEPLVEQVIQHMQMGVKRVSAIVTSLNHFNRKHEGHEEVCELGMIIDNCLLILNHESKDRCEIIRKVPDEKMEVVGNEGELHQVFLNLISNAIQAIEKTGLIQLELMRTEDHMIQMVLEDNGVGIPEVNLKRIFDPFFTTKEPGKGTGLGLSIVYKIVKNHGGDIEYSHVPTGGTRVRLTLPAHNTN